MAKKSSRQWLNEHFNDPYVKLAQKEGYRSRAVYKLLELQEKYKLFKPGMTVIDLGAAPGSWSQIIAKFVGKTGKTLATDILAMDALPQVDFLQGDFSDESFYDTLLTHIGTENVDWVVSDMAPNMSGINTVDQSKAMYLCELALSLADKILTAQGGFLIKAFQGEGFEAFLLDVRRVFKKVNIRKPKASRDRSNEVYLVATMKKSFE